MIGNLTKGKGMRGLISYLLGDHDHNGELRSEAVVVGGTIVGADVSIISKQYAAWRRLNPDAVNPVVHESISPTKTDRQLTHEEMAEMGRIWAEKMGFSAYTIVSHGDHLHIAALRVKPTGKLVSTWQDWGKSETIVRGLEKQFGLELVRSSHLLEHERAATHRRATTKGQAKYIEIMDELPPAQRVTAAIDAILADQPSREDFEQRLEEYGIHVRANVASTGKLNGYSYELDGITVTSKAMGRGYTLSNMQKRGLHLGEKTHEHDRRQSEAPGLSPRAGNAANSERNQRVAKGDRRVKGADSFPGGATATGARSADRGRLDAPRPRRHNAQRFEKPYELVEENRNMETASISPAVGHHLANAGTTPTPSIRRREGGGADVWWPLSDADLHASGLPGVAWWKYRDIEGAAGGVAEPQLLIGLHDGAQIELRRDSVSATTATPAAEVAMLALAQKRGWTAVTVAGDPATKERLARELLTQGVAVVNPELAQYCARVRAELATGDVITTGPVIPAQPAAPITTGRPKLNLFGWRKTRQPAPAPVQPVPQPMATGHQVDKVDAAPPAPLPTAEQIREVAQAAAQQDDVDGTMGYQQRMQAYKLAELAWADRDRGMTRDYQLILDADERGYPWPIEVREALQLLEKRLDDGDLEEARDAFYEVWLSVDPEVRDSARAYLEAYESAKEGRLEQSQPS